MYNLEKADRISVLNERIKELKHNLKIVVNSDIIEVKCLEYPKDENGVITISSFGYNAPPREYSFASVGGKELKEVIKKHLEEELEEKINELNELLQGGKNE